MIGPFQALVIASSSKAQSVTLCEMTPAPVIASRSAAEAKQSPTLTKVKIATARTRGGASPPKGGVARNDRVSLEAAP
jgi:hypothetical protein